jgi:tetratricopeptide (TPR) repeat protein
MRFWKALFNKEERKRADAPPPDPSSLFDAALRESVARYTSTQRDVSALDALLRDPRTGERAAASELFPDAFQEWTGVRSPWDRRGILFGVLDQLLGETLVPWQQAERLIEDRRPQEALDVLRSNEAEKDAAQPQFCAAYARALLCLDRSDEALVCARRGLETEPNDRRLRILVADAQHLLGHFEEAHVTYRELLAAAPPFPISRKPELTATEIFDHLFAYESGRVRSPIFALNVVTGAPDLSGSLWTLVEDEFYWSPHFRAQHAYQLARGGDSMRAFAKLLALVQEMPWLAEATLNCMQFLNAFDPDGSRNLVPEERQRLTKVIAENGWSMSDLKPLEPIPFDIGKERQRLERK